MTKQLWLKRETEGARLFWLGDPSRMPVPGQLWIPKSVIVNMLKFPGRPWPRCLVTVEDWWAKKNELEAK